MVRSIPGDPGADKGGEGKSKRAGKYDTKKSKDRRSLLFFVSYFSARLDFPHYLPLGLRGWLSTNLRLRQNTILDKSQTLCSSYDNGRKLTLDVVLQFWPFYIWLATISFSPSASPHVTGIIDQIPSEELRRGLMLLSKVASKFF